LQFITDLGDQAVILPLTIATFGALLTLGERRAAVWWLAAVLLVLGITVIAKLLFISCGYLFPVLTISSPSGHAASAVATYGGLAMLFVQANRSSPTARIAVASLAIVLVLAIAASRVLLQAHTVMETLVGVAIGCLAPVLLAFPKALFHESRRKTQFWIFLPLIIVIPALLGPRFPSERWVYATSLWFAHLIGACGQ
jgi:membrane-associated phospholipid phosphatase